MELGGKMVLGNGMIKDRPTYLDTPQHLWTKEQYEEAVSDQQAFLSRVKEPTESPR